MRVGSDYTTACLRLTAIKRLCSRCISRPSVSTQPFQVTADNRGMTTQYFVSWLFISCLKAYRHPWFAHEVARTMYDDERGRFFGYRLASA